jgi:hypothetical protein
MSSQSNFDSKMSLFIPRVFLNIDHNRIKYIFENMLKFGKVCRIDMKLHESRTYNSVFIYFEFWNETKSTRNFQKNVKNPNKDALIVYDDPWNWIVLENVNIARPLEFDLGISWGKLKGLRARSENVTAHRAIAESL